MLFQQFSRQNRTFSSPVRLLSSSSLREKYGFIPPPSLFSQNPNPNPTDKPVKIKKRNKPPYRCPSSLDLIHHEPVYSNLPFEFRYSYAESNPNVGPIGLRGPKYSPFGPGWVDRVWTGLCAPAVEPTLKSVDGDELEEMEDLEKKRKDMRERVLGEYLSPAERELLVQKYHRSRTKRQINLCKIVYFRSGSVIAWYNFTVCIISKLTISNFVHSQVSLYDNATILELVKHVMIHSPYNIVLVKLCLLCFLYSLLVLFDCLLSDRWAYTQHVE